MSTALGRSPLQSGRSYRDRKNRLWTVTRVTNAGRADTGARLPSMALVTCLDPFAAHDPDTRAPQWVNADSGRWSDAIESDLDLVRPA